MREWAPESEVNLKHLGGLCLQEGVRRLPLEARKSGDSQTLGAEARARQRLVSGAIRVP
jgi:hypothetical protein